MNTVGSAMREIVNTNANYKMITSAWSQVSKAVAARNTGALHNMTVPKLPSSKVLYFVR